MAITCWETHIFQLTAAVPVISLIDSDMHLKEQIKQPFAFLWDIQFLLAADSTFERA